MISLNYRDTLSTLDGVVSVSVSSEVTNWEEFGRWIAETLTSTDQALFLSGLAAGLERRTQLHLTEIGIGVEWCGMSEKVCLLAENLAEATRPRGEEA